jgi:hypothetical protein
MGDDRTWSIQKGAHRMGPAVVGPDTDPVTVVEKVRLREAEAERDKLRRFNSELTDSHNFYLVEFARAEARAERAEAALLAAREVIRQLLDSQFSSNANDIVNAVDRARAVLDERRQGLAFTRCRRPSRP